VILERALVAGRVCDPRNKTESGESLIVTPNRELVAVRVCLTPGNRSRVSLDDPGSSICRGVCLRDSRYYKLGESL